MKPTLLRWSQLCSEAGVNNDPRAMYSQLMDAWSEPQRHYHNLQHLTECLAAFDDVSHEARDRNSVELALWFHDAVYDPKAADNEEQSARLAVSFLKQNGVDETRTAGVERLILATKTHDSDGDADVKILLDIDLSILGQEPDRFMEYEADIRKEYSWVPSQIYREKRAEVLQRFLDRASIYQTPSFRARLETKARKNLAMSITALQDG